MRNVFCFILLLLFIPTFIAAESRPDPVFYRNDGVAIEFRILLEDQEETPWIMLQDQEGSPQRVSKEIVIGNGDIAGFTIGNYRPNFEDDSGFTIHFKPDSWKKIRETTGKLKGKRVALVKDGQIFWSPMMNEALIRSAVVSFGDKETSVEKFLNDFPTEKFPEHLNSDPLYEQFILDWVKIHPNDLDIKNSLRDLSTPKIYEQFLVNWTNSHPKDWKTMYELVNYYFEDKSHPEASKALPVAQRLVKLKPKDSEIQMRLMQCYLLLGNNEKALETGMQALSQVPKPDHLFLNRMVGEIHYEMGHKNEALKNFEASLENIKQTKFPTSDKSLEEITGVVLPKKEEMIQETMDRINYILAH